ncbi:hypothetical protein [Paremcibacter congregatus]|uniref:hypothetical protein n=1 Tax=Paremcibacter congregatus TaxID=2043170 RepID=UPI003A8F107B
MKELTVEEMGIVTGGMENITVIGHPPSGGGSTGFPAFFDFGAIGADGSYGGYAGYNGPASANEPAPNEEGEGGPSGPPPGPYAEIVMTAPDGTEYVLPRGFTPTNDGNHYFMEAPDGSLHNTFWWQTQIDNVTIDKVEVFLDLVKIAGASVSGGVSGYAGQLAAWAGMAGFAAEALDDIK